MKKINLILRQLSLWVLVFGFLSCESDQEVVNEDTTTDGTILSEISDLDKASNNRNPLVYSVVTGNRTLKVYMDPKFDSKVKKALDKALKLYNDLDLRISFKRINNKKKSDIKILAYYEKDEVLSIGSNFPKNGNPGKTIKLNTRFYKNNKPRGLNMVNGIKHEIMHAIGFKERQINRESTKNFNTLSDRPYESRVHAEFPLRLEESYSEEAVLWDDFINYRTIGTQPTRVDKDALNSVYGK